MAGLGQQKGGVGYFVSMAVDDFVFIGGAMVTDCTGLPVEFRYTEPVRANRLQRVLYGDVLERFIHTDVILTNLLGRMEQKTSLIIVSDDSFINAVNGSSATGVWIAETRIPKLAGIGEVQVLAVDEFLLQCSDTGSPYRVRTAPDSTTPETRAEVARQILELAKTMEITEPLRRIESAIKLIWEESSENAISPEVVEG